MSDLGLTTITVSPVNDTPVASSDNFAEDVNVPISGNVVLNDSDAEGTPLSASVVTGPSSGNLVLNSNSSFIYTPVADFQGEVTFTYGVSDGQSSATATVTLAVGGASVEDADVPFATLCGLPETLLCDPMDDTPSLVLRYRSTSHLTMTQAINTLWSMAARIQPDRTIVLGKESKS